MDFKKVLNCEFDEIYSLMEESFPIYERRSYQEAKAVLSDDDYALYHIEDGGQKIGFISVWQLDGFCFIEHFAIAPIYRNSGYGAKALDLAKSQFKTLVLEAEPNINQIATRRLAFYKRNGFCENLFEYWQPAYRKGEEDVRLVLLSYPCLVENEEKVVKEIYKKVYGR